MKFIATSNKVTAETIQFHDKPPSLQAIIENNPAFVKAFNTNENTSFPNFVHSQRSNPASIIQQSSSSSSANFQNNNVKNTFDHAPRGLLSAICSAYNQHHHLILRPDDVWQAILTQFSFYVNANAEALRDEFVDFDGKKELVIVSNGTLFTYDFGSFAKRMVDEQISKNLKDASVTDWLLPNFTTTRDEDRIVSAVTIMSTLQAYFEYKCCLTCGIPTVTLEGTGDDWRLLRQKIDRLPQYDISSSSTTQSPNNIMSEWHGMLSKVLDEFVKSKEGNPDLHFWDTVCSHEGGGSGPSYLSGWVTVFACFNAKGEWKGRRQSYYGKDWPMIDMGNLPVGAVSVPVTVDDNGTEYKTQMVAGQMAYNVVGDKLDTIQPRSDWCIALDEKDDPRKKSKFMK